MHHLPPIGSELRESFDIRDLVAIGTGERQACLSLEARADARKVFELDRYRKAVRRVSYIAMMPNDDICLVSFGRRLSMRVDWNFTTGKKSCSALR